MSYDLEIDLHVDYYCICHVPTFTDLFSSVYTCLFVGVGVRLTSSKHGLQSLNVKDFLTYAAKTTIASETSDGLYSCMEMAKLECT